MSEWYEVAVTFVLGAGVGAAVLYAVLFHLEEPTDNEVAAWIATCPHHRLTPTPSGLRCFVCGSLEKETRDE